MGNIRHRFGGHLCAARLLDPTPAVCPCTIVRRSTLGEGAETAGEGQRDGVTDSGTEPSQVATTGDLEEIA